MNKPFAISLQRNVKAATFAKGECRVFVVQRPFQTSDIDFYALLYHYTMFWLRYYFNIEFNSKGRIVSTLGSLYLIRHKNSTIKFADRSFAAGFKLFTLLFAIPFSVKIRKA